MARVCGSSSIHIHVGVTAKNAGDHAKTRLLTNLQTTVWMAAIRLQADIKLKCCARTTYDPKRKLELRRILLMAWLTKVIDCLQFWLFRRAKIRGQLRRLRLELNDALVLARTYLNTTEAGSYNTPSYRCATDAYDKGVDLLVGFDIFDSDGLDTVMSAYARIGDFNRCLQFVHDAVDTPRFGQQVSRARLKAESARQSVKLAITVVGNALSRYE